MARRRRGIDLNQPRPLRMVEDLDSAACVVIDKAASQTLSRNIMYFHLGMMAAFITFILAPVAWILALLNIVLSPKLAARHIESTPHGVRIRPLFLREEPTIEHARNPTSLGPGPIGLGTPEAPTFLPFSEIDAITATDFSLRFELAGGGVHEEMLELTSRADIVRLGDALRTAMSRAQGAMTMTAEEADAERRKLAQVVRQPQ